MKSFTIILSLLVLLVSLAAAGCISSPAPTATITPTPVPTAASSAGPTLIGNDNEAHIQFNYQFGEMNEYDGQKSSPGMTFYTLQVKVISDKPVQTSPDWFWIEYKVNDSAPLVTRQPFSTYMFTYPTGTISSDTGAARGGLIFEIPQDMASGYPKPYYYMPLDKQEGPYKVLDKVYGVMGPVS